MIRNLYILKKMCEMRQYLESKALQPVHPSYINMLWHLCSNAFPNTSRLDWKSVWVEERDLLLLFMHACSLVCLSLIRDFQANRDASKVCDKLHRDIEAHASLVCHEKLSDILAEFENQLSVALVKQLVLLFEVGGTDTWAAIRSLVKGESEAAAMAFCSVIAGFELSQATVEKMVLDLKEYARKLAERKSREESGKVLIRMKDRFSDVFNHDKDSMLRVWTGKAITKQAQHEVVP